MKTLNGINKIDGTDLLNELLFDRAVILDSMNDEEKHGKGILIDRGLKSEKEYRFAFYRDFNNYDTFILSSQYRYMTPKQAISKAWNAFFNL